MWVSYEKRHYKKSLRSIHRADTKGKAQENDLLICVSKGIKRTYTKFEKGRQTLAPNNSNACYSLSK